MQSPELFHYTLFKKHTPLSRRLWPICNHINKLNRRRHNHVASSYMCWLMPRLMGRSFIPRLKVLQPHAIASASPVPVSSHWKRYGTSSQGQSLNNHLSVSKPRLHLSPNKNSQQTRCMRADPEINCKENLGHDGYCFWHVLWCYNGYGNHHSDINK